MIHDAFEAVLFDMDGTLINSRRNAIQSVKKGLTSLDEDLNEEVPVPTEKQITSLIGLPSDQYFRRLLPEHLREYRDEVRERIGSFEREGIERGNVQFYDGIQSVLQSLSVAGVPLGLVTNAGRAYFEAHRSSLELDEYFDVLYCVDDSPTKQKAELVEKFLERKNQPESLMVGDRKYDLQAARRHDLPFIGVLWGYGDRDELDQADWTADHPDMLSDLLSRPPSPSRTASPVDPPE